MGYSPRPELPIYIAGLSPNMLRLAGEIGDGVMLWLCNPAYIRDVVVPAVTEGRQRAGKEMDGFDIVAAVPVGLTDDPDQARARQRAELVPYASLPFYRAMLQRSGFGDDLAAFDEGVQAGDMERAVAGLSDDMLGALGGIGSADEVRAAVERYRMRAQPRHASARSPAPTSTRRSGRSPTQRARADPRYRLRRLISRRYMPKARLRE